MVVGFGCCVCYGWLCKFVVCFVEWYVGGKICWFEFVCCVVGCCDVVCVDFCCVEVCCEMWWYVDGYCFCEWL